MKILELTNYSAGICGVWNRVFNEAKILSKKHEVIVFSSNKIKGSEGIAPKDETIDNIKIKRFSAVKLGGESFMMWNYLKLYKEAIKIKPDLIIAHSYRQSHTLFSLILKLKLKCRVFLVTHAPFIEGNITRDFLSKIVTIIFDGVVGPLTINCFDKVITISKWEEKYLKKLGLDQRNLVYIPNGIPKEFLLKKKSKEIKNKILFLGRISPIKDLETLIMTMSKVNKKFILEIVGPEEKEYKNKLVKLIKELKIQDRIIFTEPIYNLKEKIEKIDSCQIFILPSKSEAMPQSLMEALSRGKVVIASKTNGAKEIIEDRKNGYLFEIGNYNELSSLINNIIKKDNRKIKEEAIKSVKYFSWDNLIKRLEVEFYK